MLPRPILIVGVCAIGTLLPISGYAQIFKSAKSTSEEPVPQKQNTEKKKSAIEPKALKSPKATPQKAKRPSAPQTKLTVSNQEEKVVENSAEENRVPNRATEMKDKADKSDFSTETNQECPNLSECIGAIKKTLAEMKTASELERLNALTEKAERLLVAEQNGGTTGPSPAQEEKRPLSQATPDAAATSSNSLPTSSEISENFVSRQEYEKVLERLNRLESEYSAVSVKADTADKSIQKMESKGGFKIFGPNDSFLSFGLLLQTRMETAQDKAPAGDNWSFGLYLRRLRLMFGGELTKWLNFFVETEQLNFGMDGDWGSRMFIQDAFVEFNLHPAIQIDAGMMLPPLSRHAMQGATSLLGMDYHSALVRYPTGSNQVWRDMGVMFRGLTAKDHLEYRLAIWSGVHGNATDLRNPDDLPRFTARITANVFEAEGGPGVAGMFYDGLYLKKDGKHIVSTKRVLSVGASLDWQRDLNIEVAEPDPSAAAGAPLTRIGRTDYIAAAGDIFWDIPFGPSNILSANGQVNFYYYDHGDRRSDNGFWYYNLSTPANTLNYTGWGVFSEFGVRYSQIEPLFSFDIYDSTKADAVEPDSRLGDQGDYLNFLGGLNYYLNAHATAIKFLAGAEQVNGGEWKAALKFQLQLLF